MLLDNLSTSDFLDAGQVTSLPVHLNIGIFNQPGAADQALPHRLLVPTLFRAMLQAAGRTLAVLPDGLSRSYLPEHKGLADEVAASGARTLELSNRLARE
jgi:hypothetical protein